MIEWYVLGLLALIVCPSKSTCPSGQLMKLDLYVEEKTDDSGEKRTYVDYDLKEKNYNFHNWSVEVDDIDVDSCDAKECRKTLIGLVGPPPATDYIVNHRLGSRYKLHTDARTWQEAEAICELEGGHLVIPNSQEEVNFLFQIFKASPPSPESYDPPAFYVGISDIKQEGKYVTVCDAPLSSTGYEVWYPKEPNNYKDYNTYYNKDGEDCINMFSPIGLNDCHCYFRLAFFCEQEL